MAATACQAAEFKHISQPGDVYVGEGDCGALCARAEWRLTSAPSAQSGAGRALDKEQQDERQHGPSGVGSVGPDGLGNAAEREAKRGKRAKLGDGGVGERNDAPGAWCIATPISAIA